MDFSGLGKFVNEVSVDKINEDIEKEGNGLNFLTPGTHTLVIKELEYHKNKDSGKITCTKDVTWFNVKASLETEDGKSKDIYLQIPTTKLMYNEANSKKPYFVFRKLSEFMAAVGVELTADNVSEVVPAFFSGDGVALATPEKLVGQTVTLDIGYSANSIQRTDEGTYNAYVKNKPLLGADGKVLEFADPDAAQIKAAELGIAKELQRFPDVTKIHAGGYTAKEAKKTAW